MGVWKVFAPIITENIRQIPILNCSNVKEVQYLCNTLYIYICKYNKTVVLLLSLKIDVCIGHAGYVARSSIDDTHLGVDGAWNFTIPAV